MRETLPDIVVDERAPYLFLTGFAVLLGVLVALLVLAAVLKVRAQRAGIHRKYAVRGERAARRRAPRAS